jgi:hypothetical protein
MIVTLLLVQAAAAAAVVPTPEAEALGARLARSGSIMALLPLVAQKDTDEMVKEHLELSPAEQQKLRDTAKATYETGIKRIETAFGTAYAKRFTAAELAELVKQAETPAQQKLRAAQPMVMAEAIGAIGKLDFKADTLAAFCRDTGKLCPK